MTPSPGGCRAPPAGAAAASPPLAGRPQGLRFVGRLEVGEHAVGRQVDGYAGAAARHAAEVEHAVVQLGQHLGERQAEAGALDLLGGLQPLERQHGLDRKSEEHTSELQSLMRISYAVFCFKKKNKRINHNMNS